MIPYSTFAEMYSYMLYDVLYNPHYETAPRGKAIKERINTSYMCSNPMSNLFSNRVRNIPQKYLAGELLWYFTGDNSLDVISKYSGFWSNIANDDGTLNSAYGHLLFTRKTPSGLNQWEWALQSLQKDKDSRQAIMYFGRPDFQETGVKDFVCTAYAMFLIRKNKLHMHLYMRSNDLVKGTTFDIPFFMLLQQQMWLHLKESYPDLELGCYFHNATSLHIYEQDFGLVQDMLGASFDRHELPPIGRNLINEHGECQISRDVNDDLYIWLHNNI